MTTRTQTTWLMWRYLLWRDGPWQRCQFSFDPRASRPPLRPRPKVMTRFWPRGCWPTSQGGRDEEVGAVLFDDGVDELLSGGSPAQQADAPLKLRHERHWVTDQVSPLNGCVPHLPTGKLPGQERWVRLCNLPPLPQAKVYPSSRHPSYGREWLQLFFIFVKWYLEPELSILFSQQIFIEHTSHPWETLVNQGDTEQQRYKRITVVSMLIHLSH